MRVVIIILVLIFAPSLTLCALPPGYDEELFCPPSSCLKSIHPPRKPGYCGPRAAFHECCDGTTRLTRAPHPWGHKVNASVREQLIHDGWHTAECAQQKGPCDARLRVMLGRLDRLVS